MKSVRSFRIFRMRAVGEFQPSLPKWFADNLPANQFAGVFTDARRPVPLNSLRHTPLELKAFVRAGRAKGAGRIGWWRRAAFPSLAREQHRIGARKGNCGIYTQGRPPRTAGQPWAGGLNPFGIPGVCSGNQNDWPAKGRGKKAGFNHGKRRTRKENASSGAGLWASHWLWGVCGSSVGALETRLRKNEADPLAQGPA
jgi:hypothetical protein